MARKIATIGITINLENYENLRLEVQGEIGADGDTEELIAFLDGMLARLGHGDEATGELVDAYRQRVLAGPGTGTPPAGTARHVAARKEGGTAPAPAAQPREAATQAPREEPPAAARVSPDARPVKPAARPPARPEPPAPQARAQEPAPGKAQAQQPPREAPRDAAPKAGKPNIAEGEVACEGCGASITKNQEKLSKLLTGKSLCKKCMNP